MCTVLADTWRRSRNVIETRPDPWELLLYSCCYLFVSSPKLLLLLSNQIHVKKWDHRHRCHRPLLSIANKRQRFLNLPYSVAWFVLSSSSCFLNNKRRQLYRWQQMWRTRRVLYYFTTGVVWCVCDYKKKRADRVVVIHLITLVDLSLTFPVLTVQFLWRGPLGGSFVVENNRHEGHPAWYSRQRRIECGMQSTLAEWVVVDVLHAALSFSLSIVARSRILLQNYSS